MSKLLRSALLIFAFVSFSARADGTWNYPGEVMSDFPIAYWKLDETQGAALLDSAGNHYDAIYSSASQLGQPGPSVHAKAFRCDGGGAAVKRGMSQAFDELTVEAWAALAPGTFQQTIVHRLSWDQDYGFALYAEGQTNRGLFGHSTDSSYSRSQSNMQDSAWHQIVGVFRSTVNTGFEYSIYVDGELEQVRQGLRGIAAVTTGIPQIDICSDLTGSVSNISIYPKALSAERIRAHFKGMLKP